MRFRRRFRRFRRGGFVKQQRPTWIQSFDLSAQAAFDPFNAVDQANRMPGALFVVNPTLAAGTDIQSGCEATNLFSILGPPSCNLNIPDPGVTVVTPDSMLQSFEGEMSVLRMMGFLRLHHCRVADAGATAIGRMLEVRAWMYKTFQQDVNSRVGLVNPFNPGDFDVRILWSCRWLTRVERGAGVAEILAPEVHYNDVAGAGTLNQPVQVSSEGARIRRIGIRRAVKIKGNERIALVVAAGPMTSVAGPFAFRFTGYLRLLVRH